MIMSTSCISTLESRLIYFPFVGMTWGKKNPNKKHQPRKPQNTSKQHYHHPQPPIKKTPEIITGKVWG